MGVEVGVEVGVGLGVGVEATLGTELLCASYKPTRTTSYLRYLGRNGY